MHLPRKVSNRNECFCTGVLSLLIAGRAGQLPSSRALLKDNIGSSVKLKNRVVL